MDCDATARGDGKTYVPPAKIVTHRTVQRGNFQQASRIRDEAKAGTAVAKAMFETLEPSSPRDWKVRQRTRIALMGGADGQGEAYLCDSTSADRRGALALPRKGASLMGALSTVVRALTAVAVCALGTMACTGRGRQESTAESARLAEMSAHSAPNVNVEIVDALN